eukprot:gene27075-biopygen17633
MSRGGCSQPESKLPIPRSLIWMPVPTFGDLTPYPR